LEVFIISKVNVTGDSFGIIGIDKTGEGEIFTFGLRPVSHTNARVQGLGTTSGVVNVDLELYLIARLKTIERVHKLSFTQTADL
jgi:hypothetical protein